MPKRIYNSNADRQRAYRGRKRGGPPKHENNGWDLLWAARAAKAWMHGDAACHGCGYKECACASIAANFPKWRGNLAVTPPEQKVQETSVEPPVPMVREMSVTPPEPVTKPIAVKATYCNRDHHHFASCYSPKAVTVDWLEVRPATEQELNQLRFAETTNS